MKTTRTPLVALTAALVLGATACGSSEDPQSPPDPVTMSSSTEASSGSSTSDAPSDSSPSATGKVAEVLAAIDAAEEEVGGTAYEVDDQDDDGTWEIDVEQDGRGIEVEVAADGTATRTDEDDDLDDDDRAGLKAAKITIQDAITTATSEVDGTFDDVELEAEGGSHYWEVSIDSTSGDVEVRVDVETGRATVVQDD